MFNIKKIPFSRYGSFLTISPLFKKDERDHLYLRSVRGGDIDNDFGRIFKLDLINNCGDVIDYEVEMTAAELKLKSDEGYVKFCISDKSLVYFQGKGVGLRLSRKGGSYDNAIEIDRDRYRVNCAKQDLRFILQAFEGKLEVDAPWNVDHSDYIIADIKTESNLISGVIEEFRTSCEYKKYEISYNEAVKKVKKDYNIWQKNILDISSDYKKGKELAGYITWSCVVPPDERLSRPAMYMSKNWMTNIWSWDNCFNALALIKNKPDLAWDQIMIFFDHQPESGMLPDFINDRYSYFAFTKPPIEGWLLDKMLDINPDFFTVERLKEIFPVLEKWTDYWFKYTDYSDKGLPSYNHGNDAGWDNSTIFDLGAPLQSPDLLSFLILQMKVLSKIAEMIGYYDKKDYWLKRVKQNLEKLIDNFWTGSNFIPLKKGHSQKDFKGDSLIMFVPLILGEILPLNIRESLLNGLKEKDRFLTDYGLATESTSSDYYKKDGYWRGPIWAPSTMLIVDGLFRSGEKKMARNIARKFVEMANESGMAENFAACSGKGLRDPAFTWTSSVFLYLGHILKYN